MLDPKLIRESPDLVRAAIAKKHLDVDLGPVLAIDASWRAQVQEVEALGKPFDPNLHDAVSQEAGDGVPEGTVLRVTRRGYKLKDRLLRASSVVVAGPAADSAADAPA